MGALMGNIFDMSRKCRFIVVVFKNMSRKSRFILVVFYKMSRKIRFRVVVFLNESRLVSRINRFLPRAQKQNDFIFCLLVFIRHPVQSISTTPKSQSVLPEPTTELLLPLTFHKSYYQRFKLVLEKNIGRYL